MMLRRGSGLEGQAPTALRGNGTGLKRYFLGGGIARMVLHLTHMVRRTSLMMLAGFFIPIVFMAFMSLGRDRGDEVLHIRRLDLGPMIHVPMSHRGMIHACMVHVVGMARQGRGRPQYRRQEQEICKKGFSHRTIKIIDSGFPCQVFSMGC